MLRKPRSVIILIGTILVAFALRLYRLGYQSIWYDEGVSLHLAGKSLSTLTVHTAGDIHPPFYYYLLHFWIKTAGDSQFAAAFLSLFFGVLLIPLAYRLGRCLYDPTVGLLAAGATAISPYNLWYSQEIRMYTLGAFLGGITLYCLINLLPESKYQRSNIRYRTSEADLQFWIGYSLSAALGLYTLYYIAFLLVSENLYVVCRLWLMAGGSSSITSEQKSKEAKPFLIKWFLAQLAVIVLYLPWLPIALRQALDPPVPPWRAFTPLWKVITESWSALTLGQSVEPERVWPILLIAAVIYSLGLLYREQNTKPRTPGIRARSPISGILLASYTFGPLVLIYLASFLSPLFHVRYIFTYSLTFYIALAAGLAWLVHRWQFAGGLAVALIVIASSYSIHNLHFDGRYASDDYRAAVSHIMQGYRPGDAILINAGYVYPPFLCYYKGEIAWRGRLVDYTPDAVTDQGAVVLQTGSIGGDPGLGWGNSASDFYATTEGEVAQALERVFAAHPRLWMLRAYDTVVDPDGFIRAWLEEHGLKFDDRMFTGESNIRVQGYLTWKEPPHELPPSVHPIEATLGGKMNLLGYKGEQTSVVAGEATDLALYWRPETELEVDYRVTFGFFDLEGRIWAQGDEVPLSPLYPPSRWPAGGVIRHPIRLIVPVGTPPGEYDLKVGMYDPRTGEALEVQNRGGNVVGVWAVVGSLRVIRPLSPRHLPPIQYRAGANFSHRVELLGYDLPVLATESGRQLRVDLLWRSLADNLEDYVVFLQLLDDKGQIRAVGEAMPIGNRYPTSCWAKDEIVRDPHDLLVLADTPAGHYHLIVGLYRASDKTRLRIQRWGFAEEDYFTLATIAVQGRPTRFQRPEDISYPLEARLGEGIGLVGYNLSAESIHPGDTVELTLFWRALGPVGGNYKVFTHLLGEDNRIWGQRDSLPGRGAFPTSGWLEGEYLIDNYRIPIQSDAPAGEYTIEMGMYEESSGARLPAFDAEGKLIGEKILLGKVHVIN